MSIKESKVRDRIIGRLDDMDMDELAELYNELYVIGDENYIKGDDIEKERKDVG